MTNNSTAEFQDVISALLNEDQLFSLQERRTNARKNFVRPVKVNLLNKPREFQNGFTRDLSAKGVGLIHRFRTERGELAMVTINRTWDNPIILQCKAAWCTKTESGWYQSGWEIVSIESATK